MAILVTLYCQKENEQKLDSMISSREALIFSRKTLILCVCVCLYMCMCVRVCTLSHLVIQFSATPRTVACQVPLSLGFPGQEYWSGLTFPSPGDLLNPGI